MEQTAMTLSTLITDAQSIITATGTAFTSLTSSFGTFLYLPVTFVLVRTVVKIIKSLLMFSKKRGR